MPTTEQGTSLDVDVLSLLDFEPACEVLLNTLIFGLPWNVAKPCEQPARWVIKCLRCGMFAMSCDEHLRAVLSFEQLQCMRCNAYDAPRVLFRWWPLDGVR